MPRNASRSQGQYAPRQETRSPGRPGGPASRNVAQEWAQDTQQLHDCIDACNAAFAYALEQGSKEYADAIGCLVDAIEVCGATANLVGRESGFAQQLLDVCADVTKACEEELEGFGDDAVLTAAADACRECSEACAR